MQEHIANSQVSQGHIEESKECSGETWVIASVALLGGCRDWPIPGLCIPEIAP